MNKYITGLILLLFFDSLWLSIFMSGKYSKLIKNIQGKEMTFAFKNYVSAIFAYLLMIAGLFIFVLPNINVENKLQDSLYYGFTFGIILYGLYNMTCMTVLTDWSPCLALIDTLWGGFVYFIVAYLSV